MEFTKESGSSDWLDEYYDHNGQPKLGMFDKYEESPRMSTPQKKFSTNVRQSKESPTTLRPSQTYVRYKQTD